MHRFQEAIDFAIAHETSWSRDNLDNFGIHKADPAPWNQLLGPVHPRGGVSGVIHVAGKKVCEWGEPNRADLTFSIAKTYLAMLAGVAHDTGLLPDVHEPVHCKVPGIGFEDTHNAQVTWMHLLQQTSEWEGSCFGIPDQVDRFRHTQYQPTPSVGTKGDARLLQTPGTYWEYNDVRINQLALALLHLFRRPLPEVFRDTIARPCGVSDNWKWEGYHNSWVDVDGQRMLSVPGGSHWGGGVSICSADQALIGQMLLNGGRVGNKQVLSKAWVHNMQAPCNIANWYGMLVWLNTDRCIYSGASASSYFCIGAGTSIVWIDPEHDLVAVVRWIEGSHINGFCERVTQALNTASATKPSPNA